MPRVGNGDELHVLAYNVGCSELHMLPRVIHSIDVQTHRVYVNGRDWHYVCGVSDTERPHAIGGFDLALMYRKEFSMYPEERLGGLISSPSSQWDNIDELFDCICKVMSSGTGCVSGSFTLSWTNACQRFWEVIITFYKYTYLFLPLTLLLLRN